MREKNIRKQQQQPQQKNVSTLLGGSPLRDQQQTQPDLISSLLLTRGVECDADRHSGRLVLKPSVCPAQSSFMARHHQGNKDAANRRGLKASHGVSGRAAVEGGGWEAAATGCLTD